MPLRSAAGAADLGEGIGNAPTERSSVEEVERALARLSSADIRRDGYAKLGRQAGLNLSGGACWVLTWLAKRAAASGSGPAHSGGAIGEIPRAIADELAADGLVTRADGSLSLTPAGHEAAEKLFKARREWLAELLADWSPDRHPELAALLTKLSRAILGADTDKHLADR